MNNKTSIGKRLTKMLMILVGILFFLKADMTVNADFRLYYVNTSTSMYSSNSTSSSVVMNLQPGDVVVLNSVDGGWSNISLGDATGYIKTKYLQIEDMNYEGEAHGVDGQLLSQASYGSTSKPTEETEVQETVEETVEEETEETFEETEETETIVEVEIESKDTELNRELETEADFHEEMADELLRRQEAKKKSFRFKVIIIIIIIATIAVGTYEGLKAHNSKMKQKSSDEEKDEKKDEKKESDKKPETKSNQETEKQ